MAAQPSPGADARARRAGLSPSVAATLAAVLFAGGVAAAQDPTSKVELMRKALAEYTEAKRTISAEREEWRQAQQFLDTRIAVVQREIESLQQRIDEANKNIGEAEGKFGELEQSIAGHKQVAEVLEQRIATLEQRAKAMLPRVPAPLQTTVEPISQRLPKTPEEAAKLSLSERYQNVIGVLNAIDKWNREVRVESEMRDLGNGQEMVVQVLYVGLGQAYYVGGKGPDGKPNVAGVGSPTKDGWQWRQANELAPKVARAIAVYKNEELARLVQLPVQIL